MRTTVALLEARPETIDDDYARLLKVAGLSGREDFVAADLVADAGPGAWLPGAVSPPWQVAGVLAGRRESAPRVWSVAGSGGEGPPPTGLWDAVLAAGAAVPATAGDWQARRVHPQALVPTLDTILPEGPAVPAGLQGQPAVLLPVPMVGGGWPLAGATALLRRLVAPRMRRAGRFPLAEILAETVALASESLAIAGAVMDATIWQLDAGGTDRRPFGANLLLAGTDPVAVDSVACRLAGIDPARVPWLQLCEERGLGRANPEGIVLAGQTELLDLDFGLPRHTLVASSRLPGRRPLVDAAWRFVTRPRVLRSHRRTPWGRLCTSYRPGAAAGS